MSQHKRNTEGLRKAIDAKRKAALQRAEKALCDLEDTTPGQINFRSVAQAAHVSVAWLYRQPHLREQIEKLREKAMKQLLGETSSSRTKKTMIEKLKARNKKLEAENKELRHQLEIIYGELAVQRSCQD